MSQAKIIPNAPPATVPFKAAIVMQFSFAIFSDNFSQIGEIANPDFTSFKSAPALKVVPWPVKTTPRASAALSKIDNSSSNIEDERELAFSGRFIFISQTSFLCFCNVIKLVLPSYV